MGAGPSGLELMQQAFLDAFGLDAVREVVEGGVLIPLGGVEFAKPGMREGGLFRKAQVVEVSVE